MNCAGADESDAVGSGGARVGPYDEPGSSQGCGCRTPTSRRCTSQGSSVTSTGRSDFPPPAPAPVCAVAARGAAMATHASNISVATPSNDTSVVNMTTLKSGPAETPRLTTFMNTRTLHVPPRGVRTHASKRTKAMASKTEETARRARYTYREKLSISSGRDSPPKQRLTRNQLV